MSRIYWDTMLFVYLLEDNAVYGERMSEIRTRMQERVDDLCTGALTVGEILVAPYRLGLFDEAERLENFFRSGEVTLLPFTGRTARHYAEIRAKFRVAPADAVHLACAAEAGVDLFLTNDAKLIGKVIPGIQFIAGVATNVF